jgi:DNA-binding beta-propeller fold protein YncE
MGFSGSVAGTSDGSRLYFHNRGTSPSFVSSFSLDYTSLNGGLVLFSKLAENSFINGSSNGADVAVSGDGKFLYIASGAPYLCSSIDPNSLSFISSLPGGYAYPNNVEVTSDGRVICGIAEAYSEADFWVHTAEGSLLSQFRVTGYSNRLLPAQLVVSPDGTVAVTLTDDPRIVFVPIGK